MKSFLFFIGVVFAVLVLPVSDARGQVASGEDMAVVIALAEQGDADAQFKLGKAYFYGSGVPLDTDKAVKLIRAAADQGHAGSQTLMGTFYLLGDAVAVDQAESIKWFKRAAIQGNSTAQFSLGIIYKDASDVPDHKITAYAWYAIAQAQGDELAIQFKDVFEKGMSQEDIIAAQKLAIQCLVSNYENCG